LIRSDFGSHVGTPSNLKASDCRRCRRQVRPVEVHGAKCRPVSEALGISPAQRDNFLVAESLRVWDVVMCVFCTSVGSNLVHS